MNAGWKSKQGYFPKWEPRPGALEKINKLIGPYAMRVRKADCLDLPPVVRVPIQVEMHAAHRRIYDELERHFFVWIDSETYIKADLALTKTLRLQQLCADCVPVKKTGPKSGSKATEDKSRPTASHVRSNAKLEALKDLLADCLEDPTNKVIIWSCFASPYDDIAKVVADFGALFVFLTGRESAAEKQNAVDEFTNNPEVRVIIANQSAGGEGVNLQAANVLIYFSKSYNLAHDLQSQARADRAGQTRSITRYDLIYKDSIDEVIDRALDNKLQASEVLLNYKEQYGQRARGGYGTNAGSGGGVAVADRDAADNVVGNREAVEETGKRYGKV
jgi:SNF2 family DNA or RNA helicase